MDFKVLFALVAVFVVIMSASAVCAIDDVAGDDATSGDDDAVGDDQGGDDIAADDDAEGETEGGDDAPLVISPQDEDNSTTNGTTSETTLDSNTAGNPIFILLAALAVLGIVPLRRNK